MNSKANKIQIGTYYLPFKILSEVIIGMRLNSTEAPSTTTLSTLAEILNEFATGRVSMLVKMLDTVTTNVSRPPLVKERLKFAIVKLNLLSAKFEEKKYKIKKNI